MQPTIDRGILCSTIYNTRATTQITGNRGASTSNGGAITSNPGAIADNHASNWEIHVQPVLKHL